MFVALLASAALGVPSITALSPEYVSSRISQHLPLQFKSGDKFTSAGVEKGELTFTIELAAQSVPISAAGVDAKFSDVAAGLCREPAMNAYLSMRSIKVRLEGGGLSDPASARLTQTTCTTEWHDHELLPQQLAPFPDAIAVKYEGKRPPDTYTSCAEWMALIGKRPTNEQWSSFFDPNKPEKSEYETTAQYEARVAKISAGYANLSFGIDSDRITYDADAQILTIDYGKDHTGVAQRELGRDHYIGSNAFGVTARVERIRSWALGATFDNPLSVLPSKLQMHMTPEQARDLKETGRIHVLGQIVGHESSGGRGAPTIDSPIDTFRSQIDIRVLPICVAYSSAQRRPQPWPEQW